jgi:transcription termination factor Rho
VTETDLITAGGSSEDVELPNTVNSDISTPAEADAPSATTAAETAPSADVASGDRAASLSTMVLPELRTLAKQIGVEGASGMRKGDLIAAIRERRGESNGRSAREATDTSSTQAPAPDTATDERSAGEAADEQPRQRRERRGATREAGAADGEQNKQDGGQQNKAGAQRDQAQKRDGKADGGDQQQGDQQGGQNRGGGGGGGGGNEGAGNEGAGAGNPQCSDTVDNDGDGKVDSADPNCHTDGNPANEASYNPNGSESGGAQNLNAGALPFTGTDVIGVALAGLLMLAGGLMLRRREDVRTVR